MKFEFERTKVELKIYGQEMQISMPTEDQVMKLQEDISLCDKDVPKMLKARRAFLNSLGIPAEVLASMEFKHVTKLADGLIGDLGKKD